MAVDKPRVFVSYSHKDRSLAEELVAALEGAGADPLWDEDIPPGSEFSEKIQAFLAHSHLFVPLLTRSSASRPWVHQEICLLYTSPSPRDRTRSRMPSSA